MLDDKTLRAIDRMMESETKSSSGPKDRLHHDFETYSDSNLLKTGSDYYSRHSSTEVLMCAYATNDDDPSLWVPAEGEKIHPELADAIADPNVLKYAWNKPFEWSIWANTLGVKTRHALWRDPMIIAMTLSFPGKLESVGKIIGLEEDKQKMSRGKALIRRFCVPRKPTKNLPHTRTTWDMSPEEWDEFKDYCIRDVESERAIWHKLKKYQMPTQEWTYWVLDQIINQAGIPINMDYVDNAIRYYEHSVGWMKAEMKELTRLDNPNSNQQILKWLQENGYPFDDMKKGHVARAKDRCDEEIRDGIYDADPDQLALVENVRRVLELRLQASAASPKKYYALKRAVPDDGNLRNCFQFAGAQRTWRWAGRLFQAQNLPRPEKYLEKNLPAHAKALGSLPPRALDLLYPDPIGLLKSGIRPAAQAPEGKMFCDADLSAIENRGLGWVAGDSKILGVFADNKDPYVDFATYMYGASYDRLWDEYRAGDSTKRTVAKPGVLGCGYMLGAGKEKVNPKTGEVEATGLLGYAWNMGIKLTMEQSEKSVQVFRDTFVDVKRFWYAIESAALDCMRTGRPTRHREIVFDRRGPFLRMRLPSGRHLHYYKPRVEPKKTPWGEMRDNLTYMGLNSQGQWVRLSTHPGKLTENAVQAISRDVLAHGMLLAHKEGLDIRIHVHDQLVCVSDEDEVEKDLKLLNECMCVEPVWAKGFPLGAAGFVSKVFMKD